MAYALFYMCQTFRATLPWSDCFKWWGATEECYGNKEKVCYSFHSALYLFNFWSFPFLSHDTLFKFMATKGKRELFLHFSCSIQSERIR